MKGILFLLTLMHFSSVLVAEQSNDIVLITITNNSLKKLGFPLNRNRYTQMLDANAIASNI